MKPARHARRCVPTTKPCPKCGGSFEQTRSGQTLCYGCGEATRLTQTTTKRPRTKPARIIYATDFLINLPAMRAELARLEAGGGHFYVPRSGEEVAS